MTGSYWCEHALIAGRVESSVALSIDAGKFSSVKVGVAAADEVRLPGLTLPGFANAHSHAFHRALRGRVQADRGDFWTWRDIMYLAAVRLKPDGYHHLARAVFGEMALAGMTAVGEFHYLHHQADGSSYADPNAMGEAVLAAATDAGVRITLLDTLYLHSGMDVDGRREPEGVQLRFSDRSADGWLDRVDAIVVNERQLVGAAIHSVRAVDPAAMEHVAAWARRTTAPLHAHVSEQRAENDACAAAYGCTPTELLDSCGVLDTNFTAVHATHLTDGDVRRLGACQCTVCMCPTTERDLGDGIGPTPELVAAGVELSLGSDSHAVIDQMVEARTVELHERLRSERRGIHDAAELMHMATTAGHRSLGWDDAGSITVGARADLVTLKTDSVRMAGASVEHLLEAAVFAATTNDITSVVIDGEPVVVDGEHLRVDVARELSSAMEELFE